MTAVAQSVTLTPRRSYQRHVAALLDEIERRRLQLLVLRANGTLPAGMRELKAELQAVREELALTLRSRSAPAASGG